MKGKILAALITLLAVGFLPHQARAQQVYTQTTVSVNSATVPVSVIPSTSIKSTWAIKPRSTAANPILCFTYTGSVPGSAPANCASAGAGAGCMELIAAQPWSDASNSYNTEANVAYQTAFNQGVACVLSTGSTAVVTDGAYR